MSGMYSDKVMEHFRNPRNMGEIKNADGVGTVGNVVCGDLMTIYIKVKEGNSNLKSLYLSLLIGFLVTTLSR